MTHRFFAKALARYHGVAEDARHVNNWSLEGVEGLPPTGVLGAPTPLLTFARYGF
jgi:hypothetical protein